MITIGNMNNIVLGDYNIWITEINDNNVKETGGRIKEYSKITAPHMKTMYLNMDLDYLKMYIISFRTSLKIFFKY